MANEPTLSFELPTRQAVSVYLVKLPDGRVVARTADELTTAPTVGPIPTAPSPPGTP